MTHICPRRAEGFGHLADPAVTGPDTYMAGRGITGQPTGCSYCGSMSPEAFLKAVRDGAEIGPTDKSYKLYVRGLPRDGDPNEPRVLSSSGSDTFGGRGWRDLTRAEKKAVKAHTSDPDRKKGFYTFTPWGPTVEGKFYTQHLSEEQGWEFDDLWKERLVRWGYPGHPYVRLFIPGPSTAARTEGEG